MWIIKQTAIISLYSINLSGFKTEAESVYCAVRSGSLNQADTVSYFKGLEWVLIKDDYLISVFVRLRILKD
jgi:hypothetical protein